MIAVYDMIIIGGGAAGCSAAIYSGRFNLKTLLIARRVGGLLQDTHIVENYPSYKSISGYELMERFEEHVRDYDVDIVEEVVVDIQKKGNNFIAKTNKREYNGKTIVFAIGTQRKKLEVPGEKEFFDKGVSYCALCDGPLFRNKIVAVIGGSDSAAKEALLLAEYAKKVYIIYRKEKIKAEPINAERVRKNKKIEIINNTNVSGIKGEKFVKTVVLDRAYKGSRELKLDGVFVEIGNVVQSGLAKKINVKVNERDEIIVDNGSMTNVKGVYAAGDITNTLFKQAIIGAAQGVTAAFSIYNYLKKEG